MSIPITGPFVMTFTVGKAKKRVPADDQIDKLRERKNEIQRKLGAESDELRAELKAINAALGAYERAQPKSSRKIGRAK